MEKYYAMALAREKRRAEQRKQIRKQRKSESAPNVGRFAKQGYDILDQIAGILRNREEIDNPEEAIEKFGAEEFYNRFVGPMIDDAERMLNEHPKVWLRVGDLIRDNYGRQCIVGEVDHETHHEEGWIAGQRDKRIQELSEDEIWFEAYPLDGGSVCVPQSLCERIRRATLDDFKVAMANANSFVKESLAALMPA